MRKFLFSYARSTGMNLSHKMRPHCIRQSNKKVGLVYICSVESMILLVVSVPCEYRDIPVNKCHVQGHMYLY